MYRRRLKIVINLDIVTFGGKQWQKKKEKKKRDKETQNANADSPTPTSNGDPPDMNDSE